MINIFKKKVNEKIVGLSKPDILRLALIPRFKKTTTIFFGCEFIAPDVSTFLSSYNEIFIEEIYKFDFAGEKPIIIDCGANIGMATIYFKLNYPEAEILAYEPDPNIFEALQKNIQSFNLKNVEAFNEAIGNNHETLFFNMEGGHSGMLVEQSNDITISVPSIPLKEVLARFERIDFLKIDIEGYEINVLPEVEIELKKVTHMFLEYHTFLDKPQKLSEIITIIENAGFRYYIKEAANKKNPFLERELFYKMDMLVNIFCYR